MNPIRNMLILFGALVLSACQSSSPVDYKPLSFTHYQPIYMAVSNIEQVQEYKSTMRPPYVEHLLPYSPAEAMDIWVKERLRPVGGNQRVQLIIKDGSVMAYDLPKQPGFKGFITNEQDKRYEAKLEVEMRVYGEGAMSEASINVSAARSITVPEKASARERNVIYRKLIADLMESVNAEMEKNMYMYLSNYISYSQNP